MFSALTAAPLLCANPIPHKVPKPYAAQAETMRKNQISAYPPSRFGASRSAQIRFFASEARSRTQSYAAQAETMRKNQISAYPPSRFGASRSAQIRFFRKRGAESYSAVRRTSRDDAEKSKMSAYHRPELLKLRKNHPSCRCLEYAGDYYDQLFTDVVFSAVYDYHRTVV